MSIDWFTLIAQIFNLLLLLFLLRKFLYLPVLKAVEVRQKMISDELKKAQNLRLKAQKAEELCLQKAKDLDKEKQRVLAAVQREADKLAADLREQAQSQYYQEQKKWKSRLELEQKNFDKALQKLTAEYFNRFADKAIKQMADVHLNELLVRQFVQKLQNLPEEERISLKDNFTKQKNIQIQTAMELSQDLKSLIENVLINDFGINENMKFQYKLNPELVSGIILQGGEYMVEWSLNSYLLEFEQIMAYEVSRLINKGA